jgi:hypothetical protein
VLSMTKRRGGALIIAPKVGKTAAPQEWGWVEKWWRHWKNKSEPQIAVKRENNVTVTSLRSGQEIYEVRGRPHHHPVTMKVDVRWWARGGGDVRFWVWSAYLPVTPDNFYKNSFLFLMTCVKNLVDKANWHLCVILM